MSQQLSVKLAVAAALIAVGTGFDAAAQSSTGTSSSGSQGKSAPAANSGAASPSGSGATGSSAGGTSASTNSGKSSGRNGGLASGERKFIETAARHGMAEVQMGQMAQQKAQNPQVKDFAGRMVTDHGKANEELKTLASSKGVQIPTDLDREHKNKSEKLQKASADKFDRDYMEAMVKDHKNDVKEFEKQAKNAKDPEVKAFAQKTLPVLQAHLQAAQATYDATKSSKSSGKAGSASSSGSSGSSGSGSGSGSSGSGGMASSGSTGGSGNSASSSGGSGSSSGATGTASSGSSGSTSKSGNTTK